MSSNPQRPDHSGRAARARLGASASCLVVTILAANQAAARDAPSSLPYLAQVGAVALRFTAARPPAPPPPHLETKPAEPAPPAPDAPDISSPAASTENAAASVSSPAPGQPPAPHAPPAPPASGLPILPDDYARPAPVTVDDLLPYFLPPPAPASRATYEVK